MPRSLIDQIASPRLLTAASARVFANGGVAGVDGLSVDWFAKHARQEIPALAHALRSGTYRALPLLRVAIPKSNGGERWLAIPTVRDRVAQAAAYLATRTRFEREFESCSYGYRRARSVRGAVERVRALRDEGFRWVVDADIEACFDSIPHDLLKERLSGMRLGVQVEHLFDQWIAVEVYDGQCLWRLTQGVPQGSVVSPMMVNLYLDRLDEELLRYDPAVVRYADDFVILCRDEGTALDARELTAETLATLRLRLHAEKTKIRTFREGVRFLGATFLERGVYFTVHPPKRAVARRPTAIAPLTLRRYLELRATEES